MSRRRALSTLVLALAASVAATALSLPIAATEPAVVQGQVYDLGPGITFPTPIYEVKPDYTPAAMQARIQGTVWLAVVINQTGDVTNVSVSRSLDAEYGLDDRAVEAASQWKFKPAMKDGKPVDVRVTLELRFTLR